MLSDKLLNCINTFLDERKEWIEYDKNFVNNNVQNIHMTTNGTSNIFFFFSSMDSCFINQSDKNNYQNYLRNGLLSCQTMNNQISGSENPEFHYSNLKYVDYMDEYTKKIIYASIDMMNPNTVFDRNIPTTININAYKFLVELRCKRIFLKIFAVWKNVSLNNKTDIETFNNYVLRLGIAAFCPLDHYSKYHNIASLITNEPIEYVINFIDFLEDTYKKYKIHEFVTDKYQSKNLIKPNESMPPISKIKSTKKKSRNTIVNVNVAPVITTTTKCTSSKSDKALKNKKNKKYTIEDLELVKVPGLKIICSDLGIKIPSKALRNDIVQLILQQQ